MAYINFILENYKNIIKSREDVAYVAVHHVMSEKLGFHGEEEEPTVEEVLSLKRTIYDWSLAERRILHYASSAELFKLTLQARDEGILAIHFLNVCAGVESATSLVLKDIISEEVSSLESAFTEGGFEKLKAEVEMLISELECKMKVQSSLPLSVGEDDLGPLGPGRGSGMHVDPSQFAHPQSPPKSPPPEA